MPETVIESEKNNKGKGLTDAEGSVAEYKGRDEDHDDHGKEDDCRHNTDGLEHLIGSE